MELLWLKTTSLSVPHGMGEVLNFTKFVTFPLKNRIEQMEYGLHGIMAIQ